MSIYQKLSAVQTELRLEKTGRNPHFRSEYFELSEILNKLRPLLNKYKLCLYQGADGGSVVTRLIDLEKEDQAIASYIAFPTGLDAQKLGSAITYLKRYSLTGMFLIEERDDDGNAAVENNTKSTEDNTVILTTETPNETNAVVLPKKKISFSKKNFSSKPVTTTGDEEL